MEEVNIGDTWGYHPSGQISGSMQFRVIETGVDDTTWLMESLDDGRRMPLTTSKGGWSLILPSERLLPVESSTNYPTRFYREEVI
jgi:hypothetical protein